MAIPDTTNVDQLFVTREPSWDLGVDLNQALSSDVQIMRSGLEQRQGRMSRSKWKLSYQAHLSAADRHARMRRVLGEVRAPLQVPVWPRGGKLAEAITFDTVNIDRVPSLDFFRAGDWVYIHGATQHQFREIESVSGNELTFVTMDGSIDFASGSRIYPCRSCIREGGIGEFREASEATNIERLSYTTL